MSFILQNVTLIYVHDDVRIPCTMSTKQVQNLLAAINSDGTYECGNHPKISFSHGIFDISVEGATNICVRFDIDSPVGIQFKRLLDSF